jgi:hypothetical protein
MLAATEPQRRSSSSSRSSDEDTTSGSRRRAGKGKAAWTMGSAAGQLQELLGRALESVSALKPRPVGHRHGRRQWRLVWSKRSFARKLESCQPTGPDFLNVSFLVIVNQEEAFLTSS